jgi:hypothetical protein
MPSISIVKSSYFRIFLASFLITYLSHKITTSINTHVLLLPQIMMFGLLLEMALSVCTCPFNYLITLPSWLIYTDFSASSYQYPLSNNTPIPLHTSKCNRVHNLSCVFMYRSFAITGHADITCSTVSSNFWHICFCV